MRLIYLKKLDMRVTLQYIVTLKKTLNIDFIQFLNGSKNGAMMNFLMVRHLHF